MNATVVEGILEKLSEMLVFSDATNLRDLAAIHTEFQSVAQSAEATGFPLSAQAAQGAADLIENVILGEGPAPEVLTETLNTTLACLQRVFRDRTAEAQADFPTLVLGSQAGGRAGRFTIELPAHIDEDIFADFLSRQDSVLEEMESIVLNLEEGMDDAKLAALKRLVHTLKGEAALLGLSDVERLCHTAEDGMTTTPPVFVCDHLLELKDWLKRAFDSYAGKDSHPGPPDVLLAKLSLPSGPTSAEEPLVDHAVAPRPTPALTPEAASVAEAEDHGDGLVFEPKPLEADPDLLGDFVQEAMEHLDNSDVHLLTIETDPQNKDAINAVFRAFHTIKGVAGFLALEEIQALAHDAENLLDSARKEERVLQGGVLDLVFEAVDVMKHCVENVSRALTAGEELATVDKLPGLVRRIRKTLRGEKLADTALPSITPGQRIGEVLVEAGAATQTAVRDALRKQLETPPQTQKLGEVLVTNSFVSSKKISAALEIQGQDSSKKLGEVLVEMGVVHPDQVDEALDLQETPAAPRLGELLVRSGESEAADIALALRAQKNIEKKVQQGAVVQVREAVKVDADRLDLLVDTIGELVIAESMVAQSDSLRVHATPELLRHISQLDKITRELQVMAMSLRMVPVRATFQKMARLVRDLAKKTGKLVEFHMAGEDTELDKTVVDRIGDPLVHIIRNAVDHGIEDTPDDRRAAGKSAVGNVYLRAFHAGGNIHIQVEDDGRGLNRQAIIDKAIERQLIPEGSDLSDREAFALIFEPGFSTAKQITEVSGRGVGMDVVKRNIEALRGKTEISSAPGNGSVFTIQLPLTLAIIDGMVVRVGQERFVLPTLAIVISVRPESKDVFTVAGRGEMLQLQGTLLPLHRLNRVYNVNGGVDSFEEGTVLVVEHDGRRSGLLVDEILGQQQIVIKSLGEALKGLRGIAGGAIMPDGRVGLILDPAGLVSLAEETDTSGAA